MSHEPKRSPHRRGKQRTSETESELRAKRRSIRAADLFCGAGGTSKGLSRACEHLGHKLDLTAINHWPTAIATHQRNEPDAQHICERLDRVDPRHVVPGGRLDLLMASPECTHHSNARGGRPVSEQQRASAWVVLRWAEALYIRSILIENVPEFKTWGPLGSDGRPLKQRAGQTYQAFLEALRSLGYHVDTRVLTAADYGDPTTRRRLFILADRRRRPRWPARTHAPRRTAAAEGMQTWRSARNIIDWSIEGQSIFERERPLANATLRRIETGIQKLGGRRAEPFIVILRNHSSTRSVEEPTPTITTSGAHLALCEPCLLGQQSGAAPRTVEEPTPTIATGGAISLIEPLITKNPATNGHGRPNSDARKKATARTGAAGEDQTGRGTTTTSDATAAHEKYSETARIREEYQLDIRFRMLAPHELAQAQGFARDDEFCGTRTEQVRQIGNAVPVGTAQALCEAVLS